MSPLIPEATASLTTWFDYLRQCYDQRIVLGIDRIVQVAQSLALTQRPAPTVITVAGTNGKGTTCCVLEAILIAAGYRVGVYSSPHLLHYTERVRIQNQIPAESVFTAAFAVVEQARGGVALTFFEYTTLVALWMFKQAALDVAILEVGMGGRLDAVNMVDADITVITTIALDHTHWLGNDRESIGREKAGIFRARAPAVIGELAMPQSIAEVASSVQAPLFRLGVEWFFEGYAQHWSWYHDGYALTGLPLPKVPITNAATALAALHRSSLVVDREALQLGLKNAVLPGRFQIVGHSPLVILDVAHNPHAAAYLAEQLKKTIQQLPALEKSRALHAVVGMLSDKDIAGTLSYLKSCVDRWYCAPLEGSPRCGSVQAVLAYLPAEARSFGCILEAWHHAMMQAQPEDIVVVFGSFHAVSPILAYLENRV